MSERNGHPLPEELLQLALGDLGADATGRVQAHIAECPECLTQVEEFRETDHEFSTYYHSDFKLSIPPPPREWLGFRSALRDQVSVQSTAGARLKSYLASYTRMPRLARAMTLACAMALVVVAVVRLTQAPVVSAGEILRRAITAERDSLKKVTRAAVYQKLRVRVGRTTLTRVVFRDVEHHRQVDRWTAIDQAATPLAVVPDLPNEFQAAKLDWDDPLSPESMQGWLADREKRGQARQEVREEAGALTVISRESTAPVIEAQFVVRSNDYHPISASYRFQGRADDVEFTEVAYEVRGLDTLEASIRAELSIGSDAPRSGLASPAEPPTTGNAMSSNLKEVEVEALYALHRHNADLGGETEVTRLEGSVKVVGVVVSGQRKTELRAALAHLPDLHVELYTAQEAADSQAREIAAAPDSASAPGTGVPALRDALAARFPDQISRDAFVLQVLESSQQALAHGFALNRLARLHSVETVNAPSRVARSEVLTMWADHLKALRNDLDSLSERLAPVAGAVQMPGVLPSTSDALQPWQESLVADLQKLNRIVNLLVSSSEGDQAQTGALLREYQELAGRLRGDVARLSAGTIGL